MANAATNLNLAIAAAALSTAAAAVDGARALFCLGPGFVFDSAVLLLQVAACAAIASALGLEANRQRRARDDSPEQGRLMTLAVLGCAALALAAFLVSLRLGACS